MILHYNYDNYIPAMLGNIVCKKGKKGLKVFMNGGGIDTESSTVTHTEHDVIKHRDGKTETKKRIVVDACFCYMYQLSIGDNVFLLRHEKDLKNLFTKIIDTMPQYAISEHTHKSIKTDGAKLIFWCANFSHEYSFLRYMLEEFEITNAFAKDERNVLLLELNNVIQIRECIGLFGVSLSDIANNYCNTKKLKGDLDYSKIRISTEDYSTPLTETETQYCINDVVILSEMHKVAIDKYINTGLGIPFTAIGEIRKMCKKRINNIKAETIANNKLIPDEATYNLIRQYGFNGGLCGSNPNYIGTIFKNRIKCADITSDYPYQINAHTFPSGEIYEVKPTIENIAKIVKSKKHYYFVVTYGEINARTCHGLINHTKIINAPSNATERHYTKDDCLKNNICYIDKCCNGKIIKAYNMQICINDVDRETINMMYTYKNVSIQKAWIFTRSAVAPKFLRDNMNYEYEKKNTLKANGQSNTLEYVETKKRVNGHYGMTVTRLYKDNLEFDNNQKKWIKTRNTWDKLKEQMWLNPFIGFYTTSYARQLLCMFISRYPDLIVQYDTDSLDFIADDSEESKKLQQELQDFNVRTIEKNNRIFNNNPMFADLGTWDIEEECYDYFMPMGAKKYVKTYFDKKKNKIVTTPVIAGLPKEALNRYTDDKKLSTDELYAELQKVLDDSVIFQYEYCLKLSSVYNDAPEKHAIELTDYKGVKGVQTFSCYHALINSDFTMSLEKTLKQYVSLIKTENTPYIIRDNVDNVMSKYFK